jgi:hypothetical protein
MCNKVPLYSAKNLPKTPCKNLLKIPQKLPKTPQKSFMQENNLTEQQKIVYEIVKKHSQLVKNNPIRIRFIKPYDPIYIVIIKKIYRYFKKKLTKINEIITKNL